jgi:hypothetical protein
MHFSEKARLWFYIAPPVVVTLFDVLADLKLKDFSVGGTLLSLIGAANILNGMSPADAKDRVQKAVNRAVSNLDGSQITLDDLRAIA